MEAPIRVRVRGMFICAHLTAMFALSVPCLRPPYHVCAHLALGCAHLTLRPPYAAPTILFMVEWPKFGTGMKLRLNIVHWTGLFFKVFRPDFFYEFLK